MPVSLHTNRVPSWQRWAPARQAPVPPLPAAPELLRDLVDSGDVPPEKMFEGAQRRNTILTWIVRAAGTLGMWLGLSLVFAPISRVLDILPMLGTIGSWGIGIVTGMISLFLSLLTIAVGWIFYRPLLGGALIAIVIGLIVWSRRRGSSSPPPSAMPPPPPPAGTPM